MYRTMIAAIALVSAAQNAFAQESKAAQQTRTRLKQVIAEIDIKEIGTKAFFEDVNRELDKTINIKIDNASGVSNNTKLSYKGKKVTVEKLLNDVADKYEFGWVVISNPDNNKIDGWVIIRKSKERGYEAGKEPKKTSAVPRLPFSARAETSMESRHIVFATPQAAWKGTTR
jgi:hypothetical protein